MNKFLSEYDTKTAEPQHVPHQEEVAFDQEQQNYFPDPIEEQSYYSEPQEYYQEPQEHQSFYPEPHHQMEQHHQHKHHQHQQPSEISGYNRYADSPSPSKQNSAPEPIPSAEKKRQPESTAEDSQEQQES